MKVLFITRKYPPSVGGMERFAYDLYHQLKGRIDVKLIKYGRPNGGKIVPLILYILPTFFVRSCWALGRGDIDVIHVQDGVLSPLAWLLAKLFRKPYVVVIHGLDITYKNPVFKVVIPKMVRRADAVLAISQAAAEEAIKRGALSERVHVIPLGISDSYYGKSDRPTMVRELGLSDDAKVLITVGRLVKRKGAAWFIENVMPKLAKQYPEILYLIVGEGAERTAAEAAIAKTKLDNYVKLLGRVDDGLLTALYNGADVFVMPNIVVPGDMEGFGLVSLEAALCALPLVATGVEGIKDAVTDGQNGVLVGLHDADAFEREIGKFVSDPAYAKQFGKQARRYTLEHYRWETVANAYIQQYKQLANPHTSKKTER